jgi:hypothetical protein
LFASLPNLRFLLVEVEVRQSLDHSYQRTTRQNKLSRYTVVRWYYVCVSMLSIAIVGNSLVSFFVQDLKAAVTNKQSSVRLDSCRALLYSRSRMNEGQKAVLSRTLLTGLEISCSFTCHLYSLVRHLSGGLFRTYLP